MNAVINKRWLISLIVSVLIFAHCFCVDAQQPAKVSRIGLLFGPSRPSSQSQVGAFRQGLRDLGYVEEKNIIIDDRYGEGREDLLRDFAGDLVRLKVDIIVTASSVAAVAAKKLTETIPIILAGTGDPVATGLIASLARPGANVTGLSAVSPELATKQLDLVREIIPKVARVAVLYDPRNPVNVPAWKQIEQIPPSLRIELLRLKVQSPEDYEIAFAAATRERADALLVRREPLNQTYQTRIVSLAAQRKLPSIYPQKEYVEVGGLMSYGVNTSDLYQRAAIFVDKILKGVKPADLPVEQPRKFDLMINLKTAKQIGLTIPPNVLARADKVIR